MKDNFEILVSLPKKDLSGIDYTISDYMDRKGWADQLAFPTFLEWLAFYLEGNSLE